MSTQVWGKCSWGESVMGGGVSCVACHSVSMKVGKGDWDEVTALGCGRWPSMYSLLSLWGSQAGCMCRGLWLLKAVPLNTALQKSGTCEPSAVNWVIGASSHLIPPRSLCEAFIPHLMMRK